jgi:hypothetical protein
MKLEAGAFNPIILRSSLGLNGFICNVKRAHDRTEPEA